ncbi:MAG: hypothetical protein JWQ96_2691 [Segetibacter sp.]|nr:hypothetical protein [Segetibacter sp.]
MVYDYVITMRRSDYRLVDMISTIMCLFTVLLLAYTYYLSHYTWSVLVIVLLVIAAWVYSTWQKKKKGITFYRTALLLSAVGWFYILGNIWMGVLYVIAGLFEKQVKFPEEVGFSAKEVVFNSFPKKRMKWIELNNVVLKDGLLTVDQKNNKVYQKEVDEMVSEKTESEFNEFCRQHLKGV